VNDYHLVLQPDERSYLFHAETPDVCMEETGCADAVRNLVELDHDDGANFDIRFKELETAISERTELNDIRFSSHFDFVPATSFTTLVPVTIEIPSVEFQAHAASLVRASNFIYFCGSLIQWACS
jgi:hypothetical protein